MRFSSKLQQKVAFVLLVSLLFALIGNISLAGYGQSVAAADKGAATKTAASTVPQTVYQSKDRFAAAVTEDVFQADSTVTSGVYGNQTKSVLVRLKKNADATAFSSRKMNRKQPKKLASSNTLIVKLTAAEIAQMQADPEVAFVEVDSPVAALAKGKIIPLETDGNTDNVGGQEMPWGISSIGADITIQANKVGESVKIGVLDTGITSVADLQVEGGVSFVDGVSSYIDDNGHGTHVAGTIAATNNQTGVVGAASQAKLYAIKVLNSNGAGSFGQVIQGIDWAIEHEMDMIAISFGGTAYSEALHDAIKEANSKGILIVAAAGNRGIGEETEIYPALFPEVISVGAVDTQFQRSWFSSTGSNLDLVAPGSLILSTLNNGSYGYLSGTSMAAPHVAGAAAAIWAEHPAWTSEQVKAKLYETATPLGNAHEYGHGLVNVAKALGLTDNAIAPPVNPLIPADSMDNVNLPHGVGGDVSMATGTDDAEFISNTIPTTMVPGRIYSVTITVRNTGTSTWNSYYLLGAVGDSDPFALGQHFIPAGQTVVPNQTYTFTLQMSCTSLSTPGLTTDWRMANLAANWFGSTITKVVTPTILENLVPSMTSNSSPSGIVTVSDQWASAGSEAWHTFDGTNTWQSWSTNYGITTGWLAYEFPATNVIPQYSLLPQNYVSGPIRAPKNWTFEGWTGTTWQVLNTQSNIVDWQVGVKKYFSFSNLVGYKKYRIHVTANNGDGFLVIGKMEIMAVEVMPPSNLSVGTKTGTTINLTWAASTTPDVSYDVFNGTVKLNADGIVGTSYSASGLTHGTAYNFIVKARDTAGNVSTPSSALSVSTNNTTIAQVDAIPAMTNYMVPSGKASASSELYSGVEAWRSFDDQDTTYTWHAAAGFTTGWLSYQFPSPKVIQQYTIRPQYCGCGLSRAPKNWIFEGWTGSTWVALDTQNNVGNWQLSVKKNFEFVNTMAYSTYRIRVTANSGDPYLVIGEVEMMEGDVIVPSTPTNLIATSKTNTSVTLSWTASTDNIAVTGYDIYQGSAVVASTNAATTTATVSSLTSGVTYPFSVKAKDAAGNLSKSSSILFVTTTPDSPEADDLNTGAISIGYDMNYSAYIGSATDVDFYKFIPTTNGVEKVTLMVPAAKNYDLYIYDASLNLIAAGIRGTGLAEEVIFMVLSGATYYLKVVGANGDNGTVPYSFTATRNLVKFQTEYQYDNNGNLRYKYTSVLSN